MTTSASRVEIAVIEEAIELLEKANANLQPELMAPSQARSLMARFARVQSLAGFGIAALASRVNDAESVAKVTGTSVGKAKTTVVTGTVIRESRELSSALQAGKISLDQAAEIAVVEQAVPGSAKELVKVARAESFEVLKGAARKTKLEAEQHRNLAERQRRARSGRSYSDDLGMVNIHLRLEPHVGTPIVARAEAEAQRSYRAAKRDADREPFECHLADAYAEMLKGSSVKGPSRRPEMVVLVSHEVAKRGWTDVRQGEVCKIPGVGPLAPETARNIAKDAFLSGVSFDGKDLRNFNRWGRHIPVEVMLSLELGDPPEFDGVKCTDCGNRFRPEFDHIEPHAARGPTSKPNLEPRCNACHSAKTARDRAAGKLHPRAP